MWLEALQIDPSYKQARDLLRLVGEKISRLETMAVAARTAAPDARNRAAAGQTLSPAQADQLYKEGLVLYSQERIPQAISSWEQALRYAPDAMKVKQAIARAKSDLEDR